MRTNNKHTKLPTVHQIIDKWAFDSGVLLTDGQIAPLKKAIIKLTKSYVKTAIDSAKLIVNECVTNVSKYPEDGWGIDTTPFDNVYLNRRIK